MEPRKRCCTAEQRHMHAHPGTPLLPRQQNHAALSPRSPQPTSGARGLRAAVMGALTYSGARMPANPDKEKCACGSGLTYRRCCSEWHERGEAPVDPIVLIKTRYSAFAYCLPEYIRATTSESGPEFDPRTEEWDAKLVDFCKTYSFRKLSGDVLGVSIEECRFWSPLRSNVLFKARMMSDDNKLIEFWERAVLTRESEDQGWKYHKGNLLEYTGPLY